MAGRVRCKEEEWFFFPSLIHFEQESSPKQRKNEKGETRETKGRREKKSTSSSRQAWQKGVLFFQGSTLASSCKWATTATIHAVNNGFECFLAQHSQGIEMLCEPQRSYNHRRLSLSLSQSLPPSQHSRLHSQDWLRALQMGGCWPRWLPWCWGGLWESREQMVEGDIHGSWEAREMLADGGLLSTIHMPQKWRMEEILIEKSELCWKSWCLLENIFKGALKCAWNKRAKVSTDWFKKQKNCNVTIMNHFQLCWAMRSVRNCCLHDPDSTPWWMCVDALFPKGLKYYREQFCCFCTI